jgi:hypothetical protein
MRGSRRILVGARERESYWAVEVASVPVATRGRGRLSLAAVGVLEAWLSFAGTDTMTVV